VEDEDCQACADSKAEKKLVHLSRNVSNCHTAKVPLREFGSTVCQPTNGQPTVSIPPGKRSSNRQALRIAFLAAVTIKGIDGFVETTAGIAVAILGTHSIYDLVIQLTAPELDLHPQSKTVHLLRHGASSLAHASSRFIIIWLLLHGIVKLALAIELLRDRSWIFPVAAAILSGFVAYMAYRLVGHYSSWLLAFALFDLVTVGLVLNEWRSFRTRRAQPA
jgi:uncharacterized membrane protein